MNSAFRLYRAFSEGQHEAICHCVNDQNLPLDFIILHNNNKYWKLETQKDLFKWLNSPLHFQISEIHGYVHDKEVLYRCIYYCYYTCIRRKRHLSFRSSKDLERISPADSSVGDVTAAVKQILISYVRAEAAQHALRLKQELSALGFSVYLVGLSALLWFI